MPPGQFQMCYMWGFTDNLEGTRLGQSKAGRDRVYLPQMRWKEGEPEWLILGKILKATMIPRPMRA